MGLTLHIDKTKWRTHIDAFAALHTGLIPVIKGGGYGIGTERLASEAIRMGSRIVAVGTSAEALEISKVFNGEILILSPWRADLPRISGALHTLSSIEAITAWHDRAPVVVELLTETRRHGIARNDFGRVSELVGDLDCRGLAFHLPLAPPRNCVETISTEIEKVLEANISPNLFSHTIWISHISEQDLALLRIKYPSFTFLDRVGTALWLGASDALRITATVLDRHRISTGDRIGYRQRRTRSSGWLLVVAGGTENGIGLESPPSDLSTVGRIKLIAKALLAAAGVQLSPYSFHKKRLRFAEPPHMQCSLLLIGSGQIPEIGAEIDATVRVTTTRFDLITVEEGAGL
jgi:alanine racemase